MTTTSIERVRSLADVGVEDIALVGNRAATLATLRRAGFPVPEGVVLTTEALADAPAAGRLDDGTRQADIEGNLAAHRSSGCARHRSPAARPEDIGIDVARSYVREPVAQRAERRVSRTRTTRLGSEGRRS